MSKINEGKSRPVDVVLGELSKELPRQREQNKDPVTCTRVYCEPW